MTRTSIDRRPTARPVRDRRWTGRLARQLALATLVLAMMPWPAHAQFGGLRKKLMEKITAGPDSSARAKDSLAQIAAGVQPDSVKIGKSLLARSVTAAGEVSDKLEQKTGISAKDAALAATGVGAGGLIAKKLGVDPMSMGKAALENAKLKGKANAMGAASNALGLNGKRGLPSIPGFPSLPKMPASGASNPMAVLQAMAGRMPAASAQGALTQAALAQGALTQADAEALIAFQQEMMQVAMAASAGDASAKARLDSWQAVALKHQGEIEKLSMAAQAGDMTAIQKLEMMQFTLMKEWAQTGSTKSKLLKSVRP